MPAPVDGHLPGVGSFDDRFWGRVEFDGPLLAHMVSHCWIWVGARSSDGYGSVNCKHRTVSAHRLSFWISRGRAPIEQVCHHCDNPPCVNPTHLFEGTKRDNARDMVSKGRNFQPPADRHWARIYTDKVRGEDNYLAKLTDDDVRAIRASSERQVDLAARYGVVQTTISKVKLRKAWAHVT